MFRRRAGEVLPASASTMACVAAAVMMAAAAAAPARAQNGSSLWPANSGGLFADNKARRPGDLLTVLVSERTQAVAQASTKASKSESATFGPGPASC
jgi:flagellar basal body L-ring protein FlgH